MNVKFDGVDDYASGSCNTLTGLYTILDNDGYYIIVYGCERIILECTGGAFMYVTWLGLATV